MDALNKVHIELISECGNCLKIVTDDNKLITPEHGALKEELRGLFASQLATTPNKKYKKILKKSEAISE